jgi:hypothetical protein
MSREPATSERILDVALSQIEEACLTDLLGFLTPKILAEASPLEAPFTEADVRGAFPAVGRARGFDREALIDFMLDQVDLRWTPTSNPEISDDDFESTVLDIFRYLSDFVLSPSTGWHSLLLLAVAVADTDEAAAAALGRLDARLYRSILADRRACFPDEESLQSEGNASILVDLMWTMVVAWRCVEPRAERLQWVVQAQDLCLRILTGPAPRNGARPIDTPSLFPPLGERRDRWRQKLAIAECASRLIAIAGLGDFLHFLTPSRLAEASVEAESGRLKDRGSFSRAAVSERFCAPGTKRSFDLGQLFIGLDFRILQIGGYLSEEINEPDGEHSSAPGGSGVAFSDAYHRWLLLSAASGSKSKRDNHMFEAIPNTSRAAWVERTVGVTLLGARTGIRQRRNCDRQRLSLDHPPDTRRTPPAVALWLLVRPDQDRRRGIEYLETPLPGRAARIGFPRIRRCSPFAVTSAPRDVTSRAEDLSHGRNDATPIPHGPQRDPRDRLAPGCRS